MAQLPEMIFTAGIVAIAAIFGLGGEEPHHQIELVPVCEVSCTVFNGTVTCAIKNTTVWSDFTQRVVNAGGFCGACGTPTECPKIKQFDEYKGEK